MKKIIFILLVTMFACRKSITEDQSVMVSLQVEWVTTQAFFLKGNVHSEEVHFRGFFVSKTINPTMDTKEKLTYVYENGYGEYNMIVPCESQTTYYFRAWAYIREESISYSPVLSFKTY